jgi:ABC-type sugar transport system ATPase subunit
VYVTHDYAEALSLGDRIGVMGNGGLVQIGTPHEIFEKPNSLFVAQHLGQPGINILQTELIKESDQNFATCGQLKFPIHASHSQFLEQKNIMNCNLGIRPQDLRVTRGDEELPDQEFEMEGQVEVFETLGAYGVMVAFLEGEKITLLAGSEDKFNSGDKIKIRMQPKSFYYFNSQNGDNLLF